MREKAIKDACTDTIGKTLEDDLSGSQTLKMILEFRSVSKSFYSIFHFLSIFRKYLRNKLGSREDITFGLYNGS